MAAIIFPPDHIPYLTSPWTDDVTGKQWTAAELLDSEGGTVIQWSPYLSASAGGGGGGSGTVTSVSGAGTVAGLTLTGTVTSSGSLTLGGTLAVVDANISGTISDGKIASAATWNAKQAALISGTNIKTINGTSLLGSGDITIAGSGGDALVANNLDQFADVTQTAGQTLAITSSTTLAGGSHSGTNTGDNAVNSNYSGLVSNATHTGDATGSTALTLATVNSNVGSFGSATAVGTFTVNAKGLITAASAVTITPDLSNIQGLGAGVGSSLGINTGTAGSFVIYNGALGTPSSGTISTGVTIPWEIQLAASDETTALTTGTGKVTFRMPWAATLTTVIATVTTAPTGSTLVVDINETGSTILSTKLSIDASEKTSTTAATAAVISDSALASDAEITIDIDQVGSTVAGAGLKITLKGTRTI